MALFESFEKGVRTFSLMDPKDVKFEWRQACCFWWGKYSKSDPELSEVFKTLLCGAPFEKFCANWQTTADANQIIFSFPAERPEELSVVAISAKGGRASVNVIIDPIGQRMGLDDDGYPTIVRRFGGRPPQPVQAVIMPAPVPSKAVLEEARENAALVASAENVATALNKLVEISAQAKAKS